MLSGANPNQKSSTVCACAWTCALIHPRSAVMSSLPGPELSVWAVASTSPKAKRSRARGTGRTWSSSTVAPSPTKPSSRPAPRSARGQGAARRPDRRDGCAAQIDRPASPHARGRARAGQCRQAAPESWASVEPMLVTTYRGWSKRRHTFAAPCGPCAGLCRGAEWLRPLLHLLHHPTRARPSRSVPAGLVIDRITARSNWDTQEVVLSGVDLTSYGHDLPGAPSLGLWSSVS